MTNTLIFSTYWPKKSTRKKKNVQKVQRKIHKKNKAEKNLNQHQSAAAATTAIPAATVVDVRADSQVWF